MTTASILNLEDDLKARLQARAAQHGRSMEEEACDILRRALQGEPLSGQVLVDSVRAIVARCGGIDRSRCVKRMALHATSPICASLPR